MGFSPPVQTLVMPSGQPSEQEGKSGVALGPAAGAPRQRACQPALAGT